MLSTIKVHPNRRFIFTVTLTVLGLGLMLRALAILSTIPETVVFQFLELSLLFVLMSPWSVQLPSGASWRPAMPLVMLSMFILSPALNLLIAIPGLIVTTAMTKSPWWKYIQTFVHVGLGLYAGAAVYRLTLLALAPLEHARWSSFLAMVAGAIVHLLVNRGISALIVAERTGRPVGTQVRLTLKELHLGYLNSYLIVVMSGMLYPFYGLPTFLIAVVAQIGLMQAISYYSSVRQLQQAAAMDGLTGIENRAAWEKLAQASTTNAVAGTVVVIDVDNFKSINDQFGHLVGDGIIRDLAQAMNHAIPKKARIFRYGGDELVVFDPKSQPDEVRSYITNAIETCNNDWEQKGIRVNASLGAAIGPEEGDTLLRLFTIADARMYEQKHRERISLDGLEVGLSDTVLGLIAATETRDTYTAGHNMRVAFYALELAKHFRLESQKLKSIFRGSIVHDIGKIGVPDALLNKPGRLTPDERKIIEAHPSIGYDMCAQLGFSSDELAVILHHHEKWNGTGYPKGLKGEEIPLPARIVALADVYDALTSQRAYRNPWTHEQAMTFIHNNSGILFDPVCVNGWFESNRSVPLYQRQPAWIQAGIVARTVAKVTAN